MNNIELFKDYYKKEKEILDNKISIFNDELIKEDNKLLKENLEYFKELNSDGKLIRGILVKLGYNLLNENKDYSNDLALAYEVFQTAILVHDDVIDKDSKRRGKETIHNINYNKYKNYSSDTNQTIHLANSIGICMGDYGLYKANKIISDAYQNDSNLGKVLSYFNTTVLNTIKGELLDVILPFNSRYTNLTDSELEDSIMEIYYLKTAHYTIIGPISAGLLLAGANNEKLNDIKEFGEKVGIAFQIQDDILGIFSDEMGKVKGSDIKEFKQTILYSHILKTEYKDELLKYYGKKDLNDDLIEKVKELFVLSKSKEYAENLMNEMYNESLIKLDSISWINEDKKQLLKGFIEYLRNRNK